MSLLRAMRRTQSVRWFLATSGIWGALMLTAVLTMDRFELHRSMHVVDPPALDLFFRLFTHSGDGLAPTVLAVALLLFSDVRSFLMMALSCTLSAVVVQILKHGPFAGQDRPVRFKDQLGDLHWLDGLDLHAHFSFPSGHATTAFSMCFAIAVLIGRPTWAVILAMTAMVIAYSRVYLNQHFTADTLAGGTLGVAVAFTVYLLLYRGKYADRAWLERRLMAR